MTGLILRWFAKDNGGPPDAAMRQRFGKVVYKTFIHRNVCC